MQKTGLKPEWLQDKKTVQFISMLWWQQKCTVIIRNRNVNLRCYEGHNAQRVTIVTQWDAQKWRTCQDLTSPSIHHKILNLIVHHQQPQNAFFILHQRKRFQVSVMFKNTNTFTYNFLTQLPPQSEPRHSNMALNNNQQWLEQMASSLIVKGSNYEIQRRSYFTIYDNEVNVDISIDHSLWISMLERSKRETLLLKLCKIRRRGMVWVLRHKDN